MIKLKVNLLPKPKKQQIHLSKNQWKIVSIVAAGLVVVIFLVISIFVWAQKNSYAQEQTGWDQKIATINSQIEGGKEIAEKAEGLNEQLDAISELLKNHPRWSFVLKELSGLTPSNVQLVNLAGETDGKINLSGITSDYKAAAAFVKGLQSSEYFSNVELASAGLTEQAGQFRIGFNLSLELTSKALKGESEGTSNTDNSTSTDESTSSNSEGTE
ncbi:PilN domain-containing protein [Patescibacteria group bacterium]